MIQAEKLWITWCLFILLAASVKSLLESEPFLKKPFYHTNEEIGGIFDSLEQDYPHLVEKIVIGETIKKRNIYAITISSNLQKNERDILKPVVKFSANIHGDETVGRQLLIYLAQYLVLNYEHSPPVQFLLNHTEINLLPSSNPDGFANSKVSDCYKVTKFYEFTEK